MNRPHMLLASTCIIFGALKMMRCQGWLLAMFGSILAMIIVPGNIIGLATASCGTWPLISGACATTFTSDSFRIVAP